MEVAATNHTRLESEPTYTTSPLLCNSCSTAISVHSSYQCKFCRKCVCYQCFDLATDNEKTCDGCVVSALSVKLGTLSVEGQVYAPQNSSLVSGTTLDIYYLDGFHVTLKYSENLTIQELASTLLPNAKIGLYEVEQEIGTLDEHQLLLPAWTIGAVFDRWLDNEWSSAKLVVPLYHSEWHTPAPDGAKRHPSAVPRDLDIEDELLLAMSEIKRLAHYESSESFKIPSPPIMVSEGTDTQQPGSRKTSPTLPSTPNERHTESTGTETDENVLLTMSEIKRLAHYDHGESFKFPSPPLMVSEGTGTPQLAMHKSCAVGTETSDTAVHCSISIGTETDADEIPVACPPCKEMHSFGTETVAVTSHSRSTGIDSVFLNRTTSSNTISIETHSVGTLMPPCSFANACVNSSFFLCRRQVQTPLI